MKPMNANELLAGLALARPVPITAVVTDSRKVQPGCIFVCFPGQMLPLVPNPARPRRFCIYQPTLSCYNIS